MEKSLTKTLENKTKHQNIDLVDGTFNISDAGRHH